MSMKKVQKETCQCDDTLILENVVRLSKENCMPVTVKIPGNEYTGILKDIMFGGTDKPHLLLYMCVLDSDNIRVISAVDVSAVARDSYIQLEEHVLIKVDEIITLTFKTDVGLLDNLVG